jgi:Leucine-rich repeat (LRR) protein
MLQQIVMTMEMLNSSAVLATDSVSLAAPNASLVSEAIVEHAVSSTAPNEASITVIRQLMDGAPVLAKKWSDNNGALNLCVDTIQLDENGNIVFLNLGGMRLRTLPSNAFESLSHLETLNLGGTDLPLDHLKNLLSQLQNVESLLLGGNALGPEGAKMVAEMIKNKPSLKHLDIRFNEIRDEGMIDIACAISHTSIKYLYVEGNEITNGGCEALAKALLENTTIEELYLGANSIGPEGAASFAQVITSNKTLRKLYVDGNQLGPQGAIVLAEALESLDGKATLKELFADNNHLGKEAAKRLSKALNSNTAMEDSLFE